MSQIPTSFGDTDASEVNVGSSGVEFDASDLEDATRRLLGLDASTPIDDETPLPVSPTSIGSSEPQLSAPQSSSQGASGEEGALETGTVPSPPTDDDLEPQLSAPAGVPADTDEETFVIVEPGEEVESDLAPEPEVETPERDYDYNTYLDTLFSNVPEENRHGAVVNMVDTWDRLNRLPAPFQNAINAMLDGVFDPAQFFPQQPAPTPQPTAPTTTSDPWDDEAPAPVAADPRLDEVQARLDQWERAEAQRITAEVQRGAAEGYESFVEAHPELSREQVDAIHLSVNQMSDRIFADYQRGVSPRDAWMAAADAVVWNNPELRRQVAAAELAREQAPQRQAVQAAEAKASQAAKVAGGSSPTRSPLGGAVAPSTPKGADGKPLRDGDLAAAIAGELDRSQNALPEQRGNPSISALRGSRVMPD